MRFGLHVTAPSPPPPSFLPTASERQRFHIGERYWITLERRGCVTKSPAACRPAERWCASRHFANRGACLTLHTNIEPQGLPMLPSCHAV